MDSLSDSLPLENLFYRTDHHWSGDACFETFLVVQDRLIDEGILQSFVYSANNFHRNTVEGFLGSYGIKVGKYYAGQDEFVYYSPIFDTDIMLDVGVE